LLLLLTTSHWAGNKKINEIKLKELMRTESLLLKKLLMCGRCSTNVVAHLQDV